MNTNKKAVSETIAVETVSVCQQIWKIALEGNAVARRRAAESTMAPLWVLVELSVDPCSEVRASVADHPRTPVALLEMLAEDDDADVRYAIAENANIPPHVLKILMQDTNPYVVSRAMKTLERLGQPETYRIISRFAA
jgi:Leucine rich repeat variant